MKIKICGLRDYQNIQAVDQLGVNFLGFIFHEKSPRNIPLTTALPKSKAARVGVFVNEEDSKILDIAKGAELSHIQLHGNETTTQVKELKQQGLIIIKAISIGNKQDLRKAQRFDNIADIILLDTKGKEAGGNGIKFDWQIIEDYKLNTPFLLSGGIDISDAEAIKSIKHPKFLGIDINSRFEIAPAMKDIQKIKEFINEIRQ